MSLAAARCLDTSRSPWCARFVVAKSSTATAFACTRARCLHAQPFLECLAYRMEADGSSFAYSGDAGPCKSMELLARDCDVLVHMCHFISGTALSPEMDKHNMGHLELARLGHAAGVRNLVVSHVTEQMDVPGVRERLIREMSALYAGNLFFGEDLMEIPVGVPAPAKLD